MRVSSELPTGMSLPTHPPAPPVPPPPIARQPGPIWGFSSGPGVIVSYDEKDSAKIEAHFSNRLKKQKDWKMRLVVLCGTSRHVLNTREMLVVIDSNLAVELQRSADPPHQDPGFELPFLSPSCPDGTLPNNAGLAHEPPPRENYHQRAPKKGKSPNPIPLSLMTVNCGHNNRIMDEDGAPLDDFLVAMKRMRHQAAVGLQDIQIEHTSAKWKIFVSAMLDQGWACSRVLGPNAVCMFFSVELLPSVEMYEGDPKINVAGITIRSKDQSRTKILTVYVPYSNNKIEDVKRTVMALCEASRLNKEKNSLIIIGDLNERYHRNVFVKYPLTRSGLTRMATPPTSQRGAGTAQAIWTTHPHGILDILVHTDMRMLSDAHNPLAASFMIHMYETPLRPFKAARSMRSAINRKELGALMEEAVDYLDLLRIIYANTEAPPQHTAKTRKKSTGQNSHKSANGETAEKDLCANPAAKDKKKEVVALCGTSPPKRHQARVVFHKALRYWR